MKPARFLQHFFLAAALCGLSGCANRAEIRFDKIAKQAGRDDYLRAAAAIRKHPEMYGNGSRLLYHMDLGLLYHYAGLYDSSITYLGNAVAIHDELFSKSVSNEAAALITNDNARPYRGKPHEIVLLHQFLAFDYFALGKYDDAVVEARQVQLYLDELKRKGEKAYNDDGMFRYFAALAYEAAQDKDDAAISMYHAVKAYRQGPFPLPPSVAQAAHAALSASDRRDDIQELKLEGTPLPADAGAEGAPAKEGEGEIVVVGHAGRTPAMAQNVFWGTWVRDGLLVIHYRNAKGEEVTQALPAPGLPPQEVEKARRGRKTGLGTTFHIKFAMPDLKPVASRTRFFSASADGAAPLRTEALTDLDPLLEQYLRDSHGAVLTRTVIRVVLHTMAAEETKSALSGSNPLLNLFLNIGTDVLADQLEQADTRTWFLLPRSVQVARIRVKPGVHSVKVESHDGLGVTLGSKTFENVEVKAGQKKFVFWASLQ